MADDVRDDVRPRKRERDSERSARILRAATRLFNERGFHGVAVDEIGEQAGATGAAIYRHFSSKEEILSTLFEEAQDRFLLSTIPATRDDPFEELENFVERHLKITLEHRELANIWAREARVLSAPDLRRVRRRERQYHDRWVACLRRCFPGRQEADLIAAARAAIWTMTSLPTRADPPVDDREALIVSQMLLAGLRSLADAPGDSR